MKKDILKWNLQHFNDLEGEPEDKQDEEPKKNDEEKTFTQEEVNKIVAGRLTEEKRKQEEEKKKLVEDAKKKEELAKLSEKERAEKQLELDRQEIEKERKELQKMKLINQAEKILSEKGIPSDLAEYLVTDEDESTFENIKKVNEVWNKAIERTVTEKLKGDTPKKSTESKNITKKDLDKMGYMQRLNFKQQNPDEYKKIMEG